MGEIISIENRSPHYKTARTCFNKKYGFSQAEEGKVTFSDKDSSMVKRHAHGIAILIPFVLIMR